MHTTILLRRRQRELIGQLAKESGVSAAAELLGIGRLQLRQKVKEMLESGGPLLLVLDDVWSEFQLKELLGSGTRPPPGSQLLLTSRRSDVVASFNPMRMELLPENSALALLAWHAFGKTSLPAHLAEVGMEGVRECGGLPLAVKVLAGALQREPVTRDTWKVDCQQFVESVESVVQNARRPMPGSDACCTECLM